MKLEKKYYEELLLWDAEDSWVLVAGKVMCVYTVNVS